MASSRRQPPPTYLARCAFAVPHETASGVPHRPPQAQHRRLSELRLHLGEGSGGKPELLELDKAAPEGRGRSGILDAASATLEALSIAIDEALVEAGACAEAEDEREARRGGESHRDDAASPQERLRWISGGAVELSRLCQGLQGSEAGEEEGGVTPDMARHAEELCCSIYSALSGHLGREPLSDSLRRLRGPMEDARQSLVPIIGQGSSVGAVRVALLSLRADLEKAMARPLRTTEEEPDTPDEGHLAYGLDAVRVRMSDLEDGLADVRQLLGEGTIGASTAGRLTTMQGLNREDFEHGLRGKADVSYVQIELRRLWDALNSRPIAAVTGSAAEAWAQEEARASRDTPPTSLPAVQSGAPRNPENTGEDIDPSPPATPVVRLLPATAAMRHLDDRASLDAGAVDRQSALRQEPRCSSPSLHEGSPLIRDLLRKTSRLDQQVSAHRTGFPPVGRRRSRQRQRRGNGDRRRTREKAQANAYASRPGRSIIHQLAPWNIVAAR